MGVLDLLAGMRAQRTHLAIVIDEYSGTEGLVTIEDLVEEILGEIEDEHDDEPAILFAPGENGCWEADARAELDDIGETIDPRLAEVEEDVDTVGGLAAVLAGHVPEVGEILLHPSGWRIEVTEADECRVHQLRLHAPVERSEEHTSELQSLMRISYAVFCLKKKRQLIPSNENSTIHEIKYIPYANHNIIITTTSI